MSGDITVGEGAAIAPGVLLQADPDSRIVIGVGVCIGMGSVIHASGGTLTIGEGVMIGAGVLIVGVMAIGDRACIGSATTVFNRNIGSGAMIPPSCLICAESDTTPESAPSDPWDDRSEASAKPFSQNGQPKAEPSSENGQSKQFSTSESKAEPETKEFVSEEPSKEAAPGSALVQKSNLQAGVYGQVYVNQLLGKLLPNHNSGQG
jgi:carbon dioxide concentrating mechanism protein CcmN